MNMDSERIKEFGEKNSRQLMMVGTLKFWKIAN